MTTSLSHRSVYFRFVAVFLWAILTTACARIPIYQDLSENDANEILVALSDRGIEAQKMREEKSQEVSWSVQVAKKDSAAARKILLENRLPHKLQLGFSGICKEKGLIPTPEEEKCRKILALKGEIINSLEKIPGVIDADVVLNIPEVSEFATESQPSSKRPTAALVIRVKKTPEGLELTEPKMQRFISNSVENLDPRDVSVVVTYIQTPEEVIKHNLAQAQKMEWVSIGGVKVSPSSKGSFKLYAVVFLIFLLGLAGALVFSLAKMLRLRRELQAFRSPSAYAAPEENPKLIQGPPSGEGTALPPQTQSVGTDTFKS